MSFASYDYEAQKQNKNSNSNNIAPTNPDTARPGGAFNAELDHILHKISNQLELFGSLISQFDNKRKLIGTRRDNLDLRKGIDAQVMRIGELENAIGLLIGNFSLAITKIQSKKPSLTRPEVAARQIVIKERLESEYNALHKQFQVMSRSYREKKRIQPVSEPTETTALLQESENRDRGADVGSVQTQQQVQERRIDESDMQYHLLLTQERDQEIGQIHEGIVEINSIFKDLGELVNQQGGQLDTIENNISQFHGNTENAHRELNKANEYQRSKGKWTCIFLVALIIFTLVVVLAVVS